MLRDHESMRQGAGKGGMDEVATAFEPNQLARSQGSIDEVVAALRRAFEQHFKLGFMQHPALEPGIDDRFGEGLH